VAGVSPRRLLDDEYRSFFELAAGRVAAAIADARAYEAEPSSIASGKQTRASPTSTAAWGSGSRSSATS
jgi:hypothetical protein